MNLYKPRNNTYDSKSDLKSCQARSESTSHCMPFAFQPLRFSSAMTLDIAATLRSSRRLALAEALTPRFAQVLASAST